MGKIPKSKLIAICLTGDLSIDYRVHKTAVALMDMGYRVVCVARYRQDFGIVRQAPYKIVYLKTIFEKGFQFYLIFNLRIIGWLLFNKPNTVLSIDMDTLPGCFFWAKLIRRKLVFDSHEYFSEIPELQTRPVVRRVWQTVEKWLLPKMKNGYTVCQSIANLYQQRHGVSFDVVRNLPERKKNAKVEQVEKPEQFTMLYQGAVNVGRGLIETLDALPLLDDVKLIVVGAGDLLNAVKAHAQKIDVADRVEFVGKVPFNELVKYTANAHVGLCLLENLGLNYYYSLPNRIFDFAQVGVPILASNFPEIRSVVNTHQTGLLVDDLLPQTIADAINQLKNNSVLYNQMCQNAKTMGVQCVWENEIEIIQRHFLD